MLAARAAGPYLPPMRIEVIPHEDTTTLFLRWEIGTEFGEEDKLKALGGPLSLSIEATNYVDEAGKFHERTDVEVFLWPHPGRRNRGQAKFTDYESRRSFWDRLVDGVLDSAANFIGEAEPGSVDVEGHVIRIGESIRPDASA